MKTIIIISVLLCLKYGVSSSQNPKNSFDFNFGSGVTYPLNKPEFNFFSSSTSVVSFGFNRQIWSNNEQIMGIKIGCSLFSGSSIIDTIGNSGLLLRQSHICLPVGITFCNTRDPFSLYYFLGLYYDYINQQDLFLLNSSKKLESNFIPGQLSYYGINGSLHFNVRFLTTQKRFFSVGSYISSYYPIGEFSNSDNKYSDRSLLFTLGMQFQTSF